MIQSKIEITKILKKSSAHFIEYVWPLIKDSIGGGQVIPVEGVTESSFAKELDMIAGIDAWQIFINDNKIKCMRGIASRIQWYRDEWNKNYPFNTFTIRHNIVSGNDTEYNKRLYAVNSGNEFILFPAVTIQAYLGKMGLPVFSIGVMFTKELIKAASNNKWELKTVEYGNIMMVIPWNKLQQLNYNLYMYEPYNQLSLF